jgi:hypothetical protein
VQEIITEFIAGVAASKIALSILLFLVPILVVTCQTLG